MSTILKNPYYDLLEEGLKQITTHVASDDYNLIRCIRPTSGTLTITLNTLLKKFCDELRRLEIRDYTQSDTFEQLLSGLVICAGPSNRPTNPTGPRESTASNDRAGTSGTCGENSPESTKLPSVQALNRGTRKGNKGTKSENKES